MYKKDKVIHFVGIGGIGMSGIAEVLYNLGYKVQGSDIRKSSVTTRLESFGIKIFIGHNEINIKDAHIVIVSSAINEKNPEVKAAINKGIPVIKRAEMLSELMRMKYGIAIAGTHGKTTTTSMIGTILNKAGFDPTIVIGGKLDSLGSNAKLGKGQFLVAEADESDGSFLLLNPTIAVVTNIDPEHLDYYTGGIEQIKETFVDFLNKVPFYGLDILCLDQENIQEIIPEIKKRFLTYGLVSQANVRAGNISYKNTESKFTVYIQNEEKGEIKINMPGIHNVYNALAAITVAWELDIDFETIKNALDNFAGVNRRFYIKGTVGNNIVVDDYAHHPTEIKATLEAAKKGFDKSIVVIFQPHRYSRTKELMEQFATAFYNADKLIITDIYAASEEPIEGINAKTLLDKFKEYGHRDIHYIQNFEDIAEYVSNVVDNNLIITVGAGDIWKTGEMILEKLKANENCEK
jgi:UDP-N-acetylmuramate--alanine ligase